MPSSCAANGKSRQFAFIGITCEIACKVGDPNAPHPWSRCSSKKQDKVIDVGNKTPSAKSSSLVGTKGETRSVNNSKNDDPQLQEFLEVMQPRVKSKMWVNDMMIAPSANQIDKVTEKETVAKEGKQKEEILDKDCKGTQDSLSKDVPEEGPSEDANGEILDPENPSSTLEDDKDGVLEIGCLFVCNLPYTAIEDELEDLFSKFESAARALEELDNSIFQGRLMHVMPAKAKDTSNKQAADVSTTQGSKTFKQKREEKRKAAEASGDTRPWNSLFICPDTVVENIARKYGVSKSDLLDRETDDLAIRIALGETQVIAATKKALANARVNVSSLEEFAAGNTDGMKRSNHVLLVKNLPYGSSESELANMFGKFGSLDKIILPPSKTLALVVFLEPAEACAAFKGLAYKRYKDAPLYLEWAPGNILSPKSASKDDEKNIEAVGERDAKRVILEQRVEGISDMDIDPDRIESRSLFVKNLNFKTSDESLKKPFSEEMKEGKIQSVRVKKHVENGKQVSMGYGFIEFDSVETATRVCSDLQGTVLDGHALILQLSCKER
ncbi:hypothetical protein SLA2020_455890 [Shorea laevis]